MAERSATALHWALAALALWALARLLPATGTRRKTPTTMRTVMTSKNAQDPVHLVVRVPAQRRSPYSTDRAPLDGSASRLSRPYLPALTESLVPETVTAPRTARVRPYWTARERVLKWGRRHVMVPAAYFHLDIDSLGIHTSVPAGGGAR
ncbi:hypothetical protein [Streptomyces sp. NPDC000878]